MILFGAREEASHEPSGSRLTRARQNRRQVDFLTRPEIEAILGARPAKLPRAPPSRASPPQIGARLVVEADVEDHLLPRFAPEEIVQFHVKVGFFTPPLSPYQSRRNAAAAAHEAGRATGVSAGFPTPLRALQAAAPSPSASRNQFCTCRSGS